MRTIPATKSGNYITDANLLKRKRFAKLFQPRIDLTYEVVNLLKLKGNERILDAGCGNGDLLVEIKNKYKHRGDLYGVDIAEGILQKAASLNKKTKSKINFQREDVRNLKLPSEYFDIVILKHVLHNVDKPTKAIESCRRVLRKNGRLVIAVTGLGSRQLLRQLKQKIAMMLDLGFFPDAEKDINLENISGYIKPSSWNFRIKKLKSTLRLKNPKPYVDYVDSGRDFWGIVSDDNWQKVLSFSQKYFNQIIKNKGQISDQSILGIVVATKK